MTKPGSPTDRLVSIDVLRGIAVLAVVVSHLPFSSRGFGGGAGAPVSIFPPAPLPVVMDFGRLGVQLFLIISGFCIHMRWAREADPSKTVQFVPFWKRRLARLYPPYFIALLCALAATYGLNAIAGTQGTGPGAAFGYGSTSAFALDLFLLVFMLQNLTAAAWRVNNGPFWSLALEEQLYLLYFPLLWMRRTWGWGRTFAVAAAATVSWRLAGAFLFESPPLFWFIVGPAFWLAWALGAYAVEIHFGHTKAPRWSTSAVVGLLFFGLGVVFDVPEARTAAEGPFGRVVDDIFYAFAFFVLLNAAVLGEKAGRLPGGRLVGGLAQVGVWSYSIYLVHLLAMVPMKQVAVSLGLPEMAVLGVRLAAGVFAGYVFYRLVEVHFHRLARRVRAELKQAG